MSTEAEVTVRVRRVWLVPIAALLGRALTAATCSPRVGAWGANLLLRHCIAQVQGVSGRWHDLGPAGLVGAGDFRDDDDELPEQHPGEV